MFDPFVIKSGFGVGSLYKLREEVEREVSVFAEGEAERDSGVATSELAGLGDDASEPKPTFSGPAESEVRLRLSFEALFVE